MDTPHRINFNLPMPSRYVNVFEKQINITATSFMQTVFEKSVLKSASSITMENVICHIEQNNHLLENYQILDKNIENNSTR